MTFRKENNSKLQDSSSLLKEEEANKQNHRK